MPKAHVVFGELSRLLAARPYFIGESITFGRRDSGSAGGFFRRNGRMGAAHGETLPISGNGWIE